MNNPTYQPTAHQAVLHSLQRLYGEIHGQNFSQDEVDRKLRSLRFKVEGNGQLTLAERERTLGMLDNFRQAVRCQTP